MSTSLTMVNRAVAIAVRVSCDLAGDVDDLAGYARSVGKRIQGTYGAQLRRLADTHPEMSSAELYEAVIAPKEFPWLAAENPHAGELAAAGDRDRARHARPNTPSPVDESWSPAPWLLVELLVWHTGLTAAKASVAAEPAPRAEIPAPEADPEYSAAFDQLRANLDRGRARGAEDRKLRRDRAAS